MIYLQSAGGEESGPMEQDLVGPEVTLQHAHSMEAISVVDSVQNPAELNALLKKIDYDPYNEDEVCAIASSETSLYVK